MAEICIVYARADQTAAERLHDVLSEAWGVWWDYDIVGSFPQAIEQAMSEATCVVPIWSASSRLNPNVRDECVLARRLGKHLIPVRIDDADPPYGFGDQSWVELRDWNGDVTHPGIRQLIQRLTTKVRPSLAPRTHGHPAASAGTRARAKPSRPANLADGRLPLPVLFHSVSSHETRLHPAAALTALRLFGARSVLVSAYDLVAERGRDACAELASLRDQGSFILLDSGTYEASRRGDKAWKPWHLEQVLVDVPRDWVFTFDFADTTVEPRRLPGQLAQAVDEVIRAVSRLPVLPRSSVLPIVHARLGDDGIHDVSSLPEVVRGVAERLHPAMIAVPTRELGPGLIDRAETVRLLRRELDALDFYQPLHLLGTGDPWSVAVLTAAGADSFDGLEWCRSVVDAESGRLHHVEHYDFFAWQAANAVSNVTRAASSDPRVIRAAQVALHNLEYLETFGERLRGALRGGGLRPFVTNLIGPRNMEELVLQIPDLFG